MDIMDNYPECTTQPHSCLQLRPKQLPPPLHPSSSPQWRLLTAFARSWYLPDINKTRARGVEWKKNTTNAARPEATVHRWNRTIPDEENAHLEFMECTGISRWGGKNNFLKKRSGPISWGSLKAAAGLSRDWDTWHLWAFWINISFCIE